MVLYPRLFRVQYSGERRSCCSLIPEGVLDARPYSQEREAVVAGKRRPSYRIFNDCDDAPSSTTLRRLDFAALCQKAGFKLPKGTIACLKGSRLVRRLRKEVMDKIQSSFRMKTSSCTSEARFLIDNSTVVSLRLCRFVRYVKGEPRWNDGTCRFRGCRPAARFRVGRCTDSGSARRRAAC